MGNMLSIAVHTANIHDTKFGIRPAKMASISYPSIQRFCADAGYRKTFVLDVNTQLKRAVDISARIQLHCWEKLPWRWVVERTFAWANHSRRLSKDYEISLQSSESIFKISHFHTLLKRL